MRPLTLAVPTWYKRRREHENGLKITPSRRIRNDNLIGCSRDEFSFLNDNSFTCYQTGGAQVYGNTGATDK